MDWNYRCPKCGEWRMVEWSERDRARQCHRTNESYMPPSPSDQADGYVDTQEWPSEMEEAVIAAKGGVCTVAGCNRDYETLDHHMPWSKGGRTSVANLNPMCKRHNQEKSDKDPDQWARDCLVDLLIQKLKR